MIARVIGLRRRETVALDEIHSLAEQLRDARTARERYEISRKINDLSKTVERAGTFALAAERDSVPC
jgi:hypothetical protein